MVQIGPNVDYLQSILKKLGFYTGPIDGIFGTQTQEAVRRFQNEFGITADGIVGPNTWSRLYPYLNGYTNYRIQPNDTLYSIANQFQTGVSNIIAANPGIDPNSLLPGDPIRVPFGQIVPTDVRYTYELMNLNIQALHNLFPFIEVMDIGNTVLGRPIRCLKIGMGAKEVFYNASFHANEWITSVVLMKFVEDYARAIATNSTIFDYSATSLFNTVTLYIVPMVNPDGVDLVTGFLQPGSLGYDRALRISQDYPNIAFPNGWKANIDGIDLNLQYPAGWENAKEIKFAQGYTSPAPRDYVGSGPLVAPEAIAVYNLTVRKRFRLILAYHSQGEVIYWKFQDYMPANAEEIGKEFSMVSGYTLEDTPYNSSFAGYKDWFIQTYNKPGYTVEVGLRRKSSSYFTI